ncbi:serine/threonine protein phosphatase [Lachnospiraceae bacterium OttesenSCG-928-D06]|nr:serine/threonine protein phosphatase [Lachnospiraceae bacterium OttesenSCG-928-D06]
MKKNFKHILTQLFTKYKHSLPLISYGVIYLLWFVWLEKTVTRHFTVIHLAIDDYIPFCELFVVPYFLWFLYVAGVVLYFFFKSKPDFYKACIFLFTGMTVFLIVSTLWPNGHYLRPFVMPRDNIFTQMIAFLYRTDTPTNLWPSIHVYNSIGAHLAISKSALFEKRKGLRIASLILAISIILSTVFIKQHSVFDMLTAFLMAIPMYRIVYGKGFALGSRHHVQKPQLG